MHVYIIIFFYSVFCMIIHAKQVVLSVTMYGFKKYFFQEKNASPEFQDWRFTI